MPPPNANYVGLPQVVNCLATAQACRGINLFFHYIGFAFSKTFAPVVKVCFRGNPGKFNKL